MANRSSRPRPFVRRYLPYLLAQAAERTSLPLHRDLKERGIRESEWRVLATLFDAEAGMGVSELARHVLVPQSTLSRRLDRMEEAGLVQRRARPGDRRGVSLTLTGMGRATAMSLMALALERERSDTAALDAGEVEALKTLLGRLLEDSGGEDNGGGTAIA